LQYIFTDAVKKGLRLAITISHTTILLSWHAWQLQIQLQYKSHVRGAFGFPHSELTPYTHPAAEVGNFQAAYALHGLAQAKLWL